MLVIMILYEKENRMLRLAHTASFLDPILFTDEDGNGTTVGAINRTSPGGLALAEAIADWNAKQEDIQIWRERVAQYEEDLPAHRPGDRVVSLGTNSFAIEGELGTVEIRRSEPGAEWYYVLWDPEDVSTYMSAKHFKLDTPLPFKLGQRVKALGTCEHADAGTLGTISYYHPVGEGYMILWDCYDENCFARAIDIVAAPEGTK